MSQLSFCLNISGSRAGCLVIALFEYIARVFKMEKADNCPYCGASLAKKHPLVEVKNHPLVDYTGSADHGTATWKCEETGMQIKKELLGQSAEVTQRQYKENKNKPDIPDYGIWGELKKAFRILTRLPWP